MWLKEIPIIGDTFTAGWHRMAYVKMDARTIATLLGPRVAPRAKHYRNYNLQSKLSSPKLCYISKNSNLCRESFNTLNRRSFERIRHEFGKVRATGNRNGRATVYIYQILHIFPTTKQRAQHPFRQSNVANTV